MEASSASLYQRSISTSRCHSAMMLTEDTKQKRSSRIHNLELKHQDAVHKTTLVTRDEEARRLKLQTVVLRDQKAALEDQLSEKDGNIKKLVARCRQFESELEAGKEAMRKQSVQMKTQTRDFVHLQTELQSLQSVSNDSAKLLAEKLALSRELNTLRPELEHLRSQLSHQQAVIAEKLSLERQLNSVEVELEAEKRSKQRQEDNSELHARIQELEKKLVAEKKERELARKEGERALSEATALNEMLEERLETMKLKLRDTREELKKCQAELSDIRTSSISLSDVPEKTITLPTVRTQGKKRRTEEATMEITIQTPGAVDQKNKRALKKRGMDVTLANVGEKSTFSITPFLNRSKMIENEVTDPFDEDESSHSFLDSKAPSHIATVQPPPKTAPEPVLDASARPTARPRGRPRKILGEIPSAKNSNTAKASRKKADDKTKTLKLDFALEKVIEEAGEDGENEPAPAEAEKTVEQGTDAQPTVEKKASGVRGRVPARKLKAVPSTEALGALEPEPKKKKRKLLGGPNKTLFDDDEGEAAKKPAPKASVGGARPLSKLGVSLAAKQNAFAGKAFSPLKRDRRGVQASFLA